jgi:two-component system chemotaxis response regulator CheY
MKILIVDDDVLCRKVLAGCLSEYGKCDFAANGKEAVEAFKKALEQNEKYDLICLDIMMPELDGRQALKLIREIENARGISGVESVKIIMTTSLDDVNNVIVAFEEQCDGYLVKPIDKYKLSKLLEDLKLKE